jgi:photosystem II stability/assembly factor-like uncharacterized protein
MKKIFLTLLIIHSSLLIAFAQWVVSDNSSYHSAISFTDNGNTLYAGLASQGFLKTTNNGINWAMSYIDSSAHNVYGIAAKDSLVFLATDDGLYKYNNNNNNWVRLNLCVNCPCDNVIIINNYLYAGTHLGISRSSDRGNNWELINNEIQWTYGQVRNFAYTNNTLYVALDSNVFNLRIYKSTNYGNNWSLISQEIPHHQIPYSLYAFDNLLLCGTAAGVYKSTNYGTNWALIPGIPGNIGLFGFASVGTKNIFISAYDDGVYVSNDYGESFTLKNDGLLSYRCTALYKFGDYLFLGTNPSTYPCIIYKRPLSDVIGINKISSEIPSEFKLYLNYPNPFNATTKIKYQIANIENGKSKTENGIVKLALYNILGKEIATLVNEKQTPGTYEVNFDGNNLPSGIYFYSLCIDGKIIDTKKLVLLK